MFHKKCGGPRGGDGRGLAKGGGEEGPIGAVRENKPAKSAAKISFYPFGRQIQLQPEYSMNI